MEEQAWLAKRFEENRGHLKAVAYRMLGSVTEADDAVQEAWLRLSRADAGGVQNLTGWADDGDRSRLSGHTSFAQGAARGALGYACARSDRDPRERNGPRARNATG